MLAVADPYDSPHENSSRAVRWCWHPPFPVVAGFVNPASRFRYGLDPLCLVACLLYATNRWLLKPHWNHEFIKGYFNDLWLIPAALPWLLWMQRKLRLRLTDHFPTGAEIFWHLALWAVLFEGIGPRIANVTGDPWDVVAYTVGAIFAWLWWKWRAKF